MLLLALAVDPAEGEPHKWQHRLILYSNENTVNISPDHEGSEECNCSNIITVCTSLEPSLELD